MDELILYILFRGSQRDVTFRLAKTVWRIWRQQNTNDQRKLIYGQNPIVIMIFVLVDAPLMNAIICVLFRRKENAVRDLLKTTELCKAIVLGTPTPKSGAYDILCFTMLYT